MINQQCNRFLEQSLQRKVVASGHVDVLAGRQRNTFVDGSDYTDILLIAVNFYPRIICSQCGNNFDSIVDGRIVNDQHFLGFVGLFEKTFDEQR